MAGSPEPPRRVLPCVRSGRWGWGADARARGIPRVGTQLGTPGAWLSAVAASPVSGPEVPSARRKRPAQGWVSADGMEQRGALREV